MAVSLYKFQKTPRQVQQWRLRAESQMPAAMDR